MWIAAGDRDDSNREAARDLLSKISAEPAALDLTVLEVINVMSRANLPDSADLTTDELYRVTRGRVLSLSPAEHRSVEELCQKHPLSAYDGAYVIASLARDLKLVSLDIKDLVEPGWAVTPQQALEALAA